MLCLLPKTGLCFPADNIWTSFYLGCEHRLAKSSGRPPYEADAESPESASGCGMVRPFLVDLTLQWCSARMRTVCVWPPLMSRYFLSFLTVRQATQTEQVISPHDKHKTIQGKGSRTSRHFPYQIPSNSNVAYDARCSLGQAISNFLCGFNNALMHDDWSSHMGLRLYC